MCSLLLHSVIENLGNLANDDIADDPVCPLKVISSTMNSFVVCLKNTASIKTLLQYFGKSLEALPGVAYPGSGTTAAP